MECNCNDCSDGGVGMVRIKHVYGNVLKLAIPLTLRIVTLENGEVVITNEDFTPTSDVVVVFAGGGPIKYEKLAIIRDGNVAVVEDDGTIPVGTYAITVLCHDANGKPMRFKQKSVLQVVDATIDAGIDVGIEFESQEWLLDGAIFLAVKGVDGITPHIGENYHWFIGTTDTGVVALGADGKDGKDGKDGENGSDGVGIVDLIINESQEDGQYNTYTFVMSNGESYVINIRNGSIGTPVLPPDIVYDESYVHTDNNYTDADKLQVSSIDDLFGHVRYDSISQRINFFRLSDTSYKTPIAWVDASPFLRDGMLSNVQVVGGNLRFSFNAAAGKSPINLPLEYIFDSSNYYTRAETDSRINEVVDDAISGADVDTSTLMTKAEYTIEERPQSSSISGRLKYLKIPPTALKYIEGVGMEDALDGGDVFARENGHLYEASYFGSTYDLGTVTDRAFLNKADGLFYRYIINEGWVQVGGSSSSGGDSSVVYGRRSSTGFKQGTLINGSWIYSTLDVDLDVKTIYFDVTTRKAYTWDGKDFQEFYSTSLANLADVAFSGSYNDLTDKPTIPESADLTGYATETYVDNAIAGLVDTAPQTLDTLNELAQALGDDPNFATTISTELGGKVDKETGKSLMTDAERTKLAGIASGAEVNVNADWNASSGDAEILNKPNLATVATSGSYNDLTNKPTIPAAQVQSDWNASSGMGVILNKPTIPSKVSDLTNDSGFTTNVGTITGVTMNGVSKGTSGVVDLGTVITEHQSLASKQDVINDLATIRTNSGKGVANVTSQQDGYIVVVLANGDTYTVNLNHNHPAYAMRKSVVNNATDSTVTLAADTILNLGTVAGNKTINLPSTVDDAAEYEFRLIYSSGTITLPSGVTVANNATLTFTAGKTYQVIISGGILYYSETTISA